jgi:hypothetical protein
MAIPGPGTAISINTIVAEFGGTAPHAISEYYRGGGLVPNTPANAAIPTSGTIALGNFYGAVNKAIYTLTIAADTQNYDVYANRGPSYVAGDSDITVQINPGVTVGSTTTAAYALLVPSAFNPADTITIVNNGAIRGAGGTGGNGGSTTGATTPGTPGLSGGNAIYVNRPTTITNNNTVAGGGGGGGGGGARLVSIPTPKGPSNRRGGGGGGGGGAGAFVGAGGALGTTPASPGAVGSPGAATTGGAGGAGGAVSPAVGTGGAGGTGGGAGAAGVASVAPADSPGGAAGNYIVGNSFVTWPATGTRQGGVA